MTEMTFYWHDYETFGRVPRRDRPAQFAGVRTDMALNEIDEPLQLYCRPAPDFLPDPESCLLTGIVPQTCLELGVAEHAFADSIEAQLSRPGTVGVGYNSIRFDDEVTRHLFWRSLIDPYAREWQNECGRWDLLDVVRCAWALRPDGIVWPLNDEGVPSFRLEHLTAANGLAHTSAHDALSDVRATIALARLVMARQPRLWDYCLQLRRKEAVQFQIAEAQRRGLPFLHVSGMYGVERGCIALVVPIGQHPVNRNEVIVWDLAFSPDELLTLDAEAIRARLFAKKGSLSDGVERLPIKTIHLNKSPIVIGNLKTLNAELMTKWALELPQALRHAQVLASAADRLERLWPVVFERPARDEAVDVDSDLYGGFIGADDRRTLQKLRTRTAEQLAGARPLFSDPRLDELLFRYRGRNFPSTLDESEQLRWRAHCARFLLDGVAGGIALDDFFERVDRLQENADEQGESILGALVDYATDIAPERQ